MNRLAARIAFGVVLLASLFAVAAHQANIPDVLFHHMACFREFWNQGQLTDGREFTYLPIQNLPHSTGWLAGAFFYGFTMATGWNTHGLVLLKFLCCFTIAVGCHGYAVRRGVSLGVLAFLGSMAVLMALAFSATEISPQLLATTLLVVLLILLHQLRRSNSWGKIVLLLFALALVSIVWSNLHVWGFLGTILVGFFWLDQVSLKWQSGTTFDRSRKESWLGFVAFLASAVGLLFNPWGLDLLNAVWQLKVFGASGQLGIQAIWQLHSLAAQWIFIGSLMIAAYSIWQSERWPVFESFSLALFAVLTMRWTHLASFYIVLWVCLVGPQIETSKFSQWLNRELNLRHRTVMITATVTSILLIGLSIQSRFWKPALLIDRPLAVRQFNQLGYPCLAVQFLKEKQFRGNLFVPPRLGSYLAWELHPHIKISIDSRPVIAFPVHSIEDNINFYQASSTWQTILEDPNHHAILVPQDQPIFRPLKKLSDTDPRFEWKQVYFDQNFALFARVGTEVAQQLSTETR